MIGKLLGLAGGLVPGWVWIVAGAAALAGFGWWCDSRGYARAERAFNVERLDWERQRARAAEATADWQQLARAAEQKARDTERTWLTAARAIDQDGATHAETLRAAAARGGTALAGLRAQLGAVVAEAARSAEAGADTCNANFRAAAEQAERMRADLLVGAYERGRKRAEFADAAHAAGLNCQRWAEELSRQAQ